MAENFHSSAKPVAGRAAVPQHMIYQGELPAADPLGPADAAAPNEKVWRNAALTLLVVLLIGAGGAVIMWPKSATSPGVGPGWVVPTEDPIDSAGPTAEPTANVSLYSGPPASGLAMPRGNQPGWNQTFTEDFNGDDLAKRWNIYSGEPGGDPGGWFSPSHVTQQGGRLIISGYREQTPNGNIYATGGLSNSPVFAQSYGRFDIRFRMDKGYGINYALLLWPANDSWPPEINIAEDNGRRRDLITSTLHYGGHGAPVKRITRARDGIDFTQWHTVSVEWTPGKLLMKLDGNEWDRIEASQVPNTPMALALQSQAWYCGGGFSDCPNSTTPPKVNLEIDWVAIYQMA